MAEYSAPLWDLQFTLNVIADVDSIATFPDFAEFDPDLVEPLLGEAARFIEDTIAPMNRNSDAQGSTCLLYTSPSPRDRG